MRHAKTIGRVARHAAAALALACAAQSAAAAQDANTNYRPAPHDPFVKPKAIPKKKPEDPKKKKNVPVVVAPPSVKARIEAYKLQRAQAMEAQQPVPKPTTALLLGETQITGIFRTPRGYAAMVLATPIKLSYVVYPGERFFDAQLVAIEEGRLVFRREQRWSDGRREVLVETKPLRKFAAGDQLAAAADKLKDEKPAARPAGIGPGAPAPSPGATDGMSIVQTMKSEKWAELQAQIEKCPNGKATINFAEGTVACGN